MIGLLHQFCFEIIKEFVDPGKFLKNPIQSDFQQIFFPCFLIPINLHLL